MAHGLRSISNKSYNCYGNGRDWFFLGDSSYRDGARTPLPNQSVMKEIKPPMQKRGAPQEVIFQRACVGSKQRQKQRWERHNSEVPAAYGTQQMLAVAQEAPSKGPLPATAGRRASARLRSLGGDEVFTTTYMEHGPSPKRTGEYVVPLGEELRNAGIHKVASEPVLKEMEGDFTRGIKGPRPHFHSTYMDLGQGSTTCYSRKHEVALCEVNRDAGVPPSKIPPKDIEGDHSLGIKGSKPDFHTAYHDHGYHEPVPKGYGGRRIQGAVAQELRDAGVPPKKDPPKDMEGDMTRGIKCDKPHFFTDYHNFGRFQPFEGKRYDFGPMAYKNHRLTIPTERK